MSVLRASYVLWAMVWCMPAIAAPKHVPQANIPARYMLGRPSEPSLPVLTADQQVSMRTDMSLRRRLAWDVVAAILEEQPLARFNEWSLPTWASQYALDDLKRMARLQSGQPELNFEELQTTHEQALQQTPAWERTAFFTWLGYLQNTLQVRGAIGLIKSLYNATTIERVFADRSHLVNCRFDDQQHVINQVGADAFAPCLTREFASDSFIVKVAWQRLSKHLPFPQYRSNAADVRKRLSEPQPSWDKPDYFSQPKSEDIYTVELRDGSQYALVGMHIMSKQLREWWWITLWWSADQGGEFSDDKPGDRPVLQTPQWARYQLCTVTDYRELAANPVIARPDGHSWCSNPYLEKGAYNAATNCIGCHQHAGTTMSQRHILHNEGSAGPLATSANRTDFPTDYVWSVGTDIKSLFNNL